MIPTTSALLRYVKIEGKREWPVATTTSSTIKGNLLNNERFVGMIENLGDAYEMQPRRCTA
jgi:hypothetical protein